MAAEQHFEPLTVNANRVYSVDALRDAERLIVEKKDPALIAAHLQRAQLYALYELADAVRGTTTP